MQAREHQHTWYAHFRTSRHFPPKNDCNVCAYVCVSADVRMCAYILCTRARARTHTHTHMTWGRCLDDDEITELNIGHFFISESIFFGIASVLKKFNKILNSPALPATALQMGAQALRMILPNINSFPNSIIESSINLIQHTNVQVQYEGYELLKELIQKAALQDTIIKELIAFLRIIVKDDDDEVDSMILKNKNRSTKTKQVRTR